MPSIDALVEGGKATPAPPLGPALGPLGVNVGKIIAEINAKTKEFEGMKVPVKIIVDANKNFEIKVGTPPTSALILKEIGKEKGSGKKEETTGNISVKQAVKIAKMKSIEMLAKNLKSAAKEVIGACTSMGVTVEGKSPKEIIKEINEGKYDAEFKG